MSINVSEENLIERPAVGMTREMYFPSIIYTFEIPDAELLNSHLLELISSERENDQKGISRSNYVELGGWHSHNNLHKIESYNDLSSHIQEAGRLISGDLGYHQDYSLEISMMWAIMNAPGSSNRAHVHPASLWSGVYYIHSPEGAGDIEFIDPRIAHVMNQPVYIPQKTRPPQCWTKVQHKPTPGKMLIFPSWLYHAVHPNLSKENGTAGERKIISFNMVQKKALELL